jgi:predicted transcriptional regulator
MRIEQVNYFSKKEYEIVTILRELGFGRTTAKVLVYLAHVEEASSRDIERGTGLRQPEVSLAMQELKEWDWVAEREADRNGPGRKITFFRLAKPFAKIVADIGNRKKTEVRLCLARVQKIRNSLSEQ